MSDPAPNTPQPLPRNPERMQPDSTALLVVDVQTRFVDVLPGVGQIVWNCRRLLDGARVLGVAVAATEQYPEKLGGTVPELAERLTDPPQSKLAFSCGACAELFSKWRAAGIDRVLVCGIETHVCVQQTVLDLLADGYQAQVAVDATGTRHQIDHEVALRRMEAGGALLTTVEAALFEWCGEAGSDAFKQISRLVKEVEPT